MIRFNVSNLILPPYALRPRPLGGGSSVPPDIWVLRLLLRGNRLNYAFSNGPIGHLLEALKALDIEVLNSIRVADLENCLVARNDRSQNTA